MNSRLLKISLASLLAGLLVLGACSSGGDAPAMVEDFLLLDVNPTSQGYAVLLSPRDQIGYTSAWYFGAAS